MLNFPALNFLNFFKNHGLLTINDLPNGKQLLGSKTYIDKMISTWENVNIFTNTHVNINRCNNKIKINTEKSTDIFDHVIIAVHADEVLGC